MNKQRLPFLVLPVVAAMMFAACIPATALAATLADVLRAAQTINQEARRSQQRIDALTDETRRLLNEYKVVLKENEGLRVYIRQLERQIASQEEEMRQLNASIDQVTVIERQITPLMHRMIDGLERFVEMDVPFNEDERRDRIDRLRGMMDRADVAVSEKFSQILNAYQIENDFGRTMEAYVDDSFEYEGRTLVVDVLRFGRISLLFQTPDGDTIGGWNQQQRRWEELDDSFKSQIRNGVRMARKQASVDLLILPITAPESEGGAD